MTKLKLGPLPDDRPVKITIELSAQLHRDLITYAQLLGSNTGQAIDPAKLIAPMIARFMATDRGFARARRQAQSPTESVEPSHASNNGSSN